MTISMSRSGIDAAGGKPIAKLVIVPRMGMHHGEAQRLVPLAALCHNRRAERVRRRQRGRGRQRRPCPASLATVAVETVTALPPSPSAIGTMVCAQRAASAPDCRRSASARAYGRRRNGRRRGGRGCWPRSFRGRATARCLPPRRNPFPVAATSKALSSSGRKPAVIWIGVAHQLVSAPASRRP